MKKMFFLLLISFPVFAQTEGTIESAGSKLHYRTLGNGRPILFINGGPGLDSDGFTALAERMSDKNQVILYDQRGTGKSELADINAKTVSMDLMVADIETLRQHLKIDTWVVLGHSFGGMLAAYYATKHPESIDGIIMSSSGGIDLGLRSYVNGRMRKMLDKDQLAALDESNRKLAKGDSTKENRLARANAMANVYAYHKKFVPFIANRLTKTNLNINQLLWNNMDDIHFDCSSKLKSFDKPVIVIQGKNDILDIKTAEKIHAAFPKSTLVLIDKCGHYGWLDAPDAYFSAINQFLKTV